MTSAIGLLAIFSVHTNRTFICPCYVGIVYLARRRPSLTAPQDTGPERQSVRPLRPDRFSSTTSVCRQSSHPEFTPTSPLRRPGHRAPLPTPIPPVIPVPPLLPRRVHPERRSGRREIGAHHLVVLMVEDVAMQHVAGARGGVKREEVLARLDAADRGHVAW